MIYWNSLRQCSETFSPGICEQENDILHEGKWAQWRHTMQPSLQHGGQNGGPTSCECQEIFCSQNALRKDKYGQVMQFLLNKNYLLGCKYAKITSFFTFRPPLIYYSGPNPVKDQNDRKISYFIPLHMHLNTWFVPGAPSNAIVMPCPLLTWFKWAFFLVTSGNISNIKHKAN